MKATEQPTSFSQEDEIFRIARQCHLNFSETISSIRTRASTTQLPAPLPESSLHDAELTGILEDVCDEHEQLRSWAKNLGAFAPGHGSLDYRLRDAAEIRDSIVSLLSSLNTELVNCLLLIRNDVTVTTADESATPLDSSSSSSSTSGSVQSEQPDVPNSSTAHHFINVLKHRIGHVSDVIDKLSGLARIIRASGSTSRNTKAAAYRPDEDGTNWTTEFEEQFLPRILKNRFHLEEPLLSRFVKALSLRRRKFMFLAKHQKKLAYGGETSFEMLPRITKSEIRRIVTDTPASPSSHGMDRHDTCRMEPPRHTSLPTVATTFQGLRPRVIAPSRIISASTKSNVNKIEIPPPPPVPLRAVHFECPYCCTFVPRATLASTNWRHHVIADLQPYLCLEPECHNPDTVFDTRADWIEHQKWEHSMEWWCDGYNTNHSPEVFTAVEDYAQHMRDDHGIKEAHALSKQTLTAGRPSLSPFSGCPLCDYQLPTPSVHDVSSLSNPLNGITSAQQKLQRHIADDLLTIFLIALPDREDFQDTRSSTNAELRKRSTVQALSDVSLTFDDLETHELTSDQDISIVENEGQLSNSSDSPAFDAEFYDILWSNVWSSPRLQDSTRGAYEGIEQDTLLRSFASQTLLGNKYRTAWITSTELMYLRCLAALDEKIVSSSLYETALKYTGGRIGHLHVIVVMLSDKNPRPIRHDGVSKELSQLRELAPSIQYIFTLAISHALNYDVRLGDVVVGVPQAEHPAVFQFDMDSHYFCLRQIESTIHAPPKCVLDACSRLTDKDGSTRNLQGTMHKIQERLEWESKGSKNPTASKYDPARSDLEYPIVHHGSIGLVAGDLSSSDRWNLEFDPEFANLLCIEESPFTGSVTPVPCVMIRGIERKNKIDLLEKGWEGSVSASVAAVAYAKLLLLEMSESVSTLWPE